MCDPTISPVNKHRSTVKFCIDGASISELLTIADFVSEMDGEMSIVSFANDPKSPNEYVVRVFGSDKQHGGGLYDVYFAYGKHVTTRTIQEWI